MKRRAPLIATLCLAAAAARAEPQVGDGVLDPWAPIAPPAIARSPAPVALIVNPWGEPFASRARVPADRVPERPLPGIVDPWSKREAPLAARYRTAADLKLVEIVDPWAGRPVGARAAFPIEGVVDPWQSPGQRQ